jgi:predicted ATPase/predicted Ser/Thr protein kinase
VIGKLIHNRYQIDTLIGKGGMGEVYRGHDMLLKRDVAIKVLSGPDLSNQSYARLLREAQSAAQLNHPNIVSIYDAGEFEGTPFIVMEHVDGESLRSIQNLDEQRIISISQQICAALEHAHAKGIIHRDIKPENVLVTVEESVKLMDFGIARSTDTRLTATGSFVGTIFYLAPEVALGCEIDERADLYALGVMLYELTTGQLPFTGDDIMAIIPQHIHASPTPPRELRSDISPQLETIILKLLAKNPDKRFHTANEVAEALESTVLRDKVSIETTPYHNLPLQLTRFIGRGREMDEIKDLLSTSRLVTLTGAGGCGKSRLAIEISKEIIGTYPDGIWLVELAPIGDAELVQQVVATALGVRESDNQPLQAALLNFLQDKQLLLILDNCEHIIDACAHLIDNLLQSTPEIQILVSSREALGIMGESVYRVPSLSLPDPDPDIELDEVLRSEAVQLFVDCAAVVLPGFSLTENNAPFIVQVCRRLDGIPLAIELAAARSKMLTVEQIASRLDDRFRLFTGGSRTALPRQQTLRALIDWSYDLLSQAERSLLRQLSVFSGGWSLEAAEEICFGEEKDSDLSGNILEFLTHLVDKSLVSVNRRQGEEARYSFLETIRQYAREKLLESGLGESVRNRHLDLFLDLAISCEPQLRGSNQLETLNKLSIDHENFRAALGWAFEQQEVEKTYRLATALTGFWISHGHLGEGRKWFEQVLAEGAPPSLDLHAKALNAAGALAFAQGDSEQAQEFFEQSVTLQRELNDKAGLAKSINNLAAVALNRGDYARAQSLFEESHTLYSELGNNLGISTTTANLGMIALQQGDYVRATSFFEESLTLAREIGDLHTIASLLHNLGRIAASKDEYRRATELFEESVGLWRELNDKNNLAYSILNLGRVAMFQGRYSHAHELFQETLQLHEELENKSGFALAHANLGILTFYEADFKRSVTHLDESLTRYRNLEDKWGTAITLDMLATVAIHQNDPQQAELFAQESLMLLKEMGNTVIIPNCLVNLGWAALQLGDIKRALELASEGLELFNEQGEKKGLIWALEVAAMLADSRSQPVRATQLLAATIGLREVWGIPQPPVEQESHNRILSKIRTYLDEASFQAAWSTGKEMTQEEAVAFALEMRATG